MAGPLTFDDIEAPAKGTGPLTFDEPTDPYQAAAQKRVADLRAHGIDPSGGILRRFTKGSGLSWADDLSARGGALVDTINPLHIGDKNNTFENNLKYRKAFESELDKDAKARTGIYGDVAELAGSFLPGDAIAGVVGKGLGYIAPKAVKTAVPLLTGPTAGAVPSVVSKGLPALAGEATTAASAIAPTGAKLANSVVTGGITGGIEAAGNDENIGYGVGLGGVGGAAGHAIGKTLEGLTRYGKVTPSVQDALSAEGLKLKAKQAYDAFENGGGRYTPAFVQDIKQGLGQVLMDNSWSKKIAPKVGAVIDEIDKIKMTRQMGLGDPTPKMVQNIRGLIGNVRGSTDPVERRFGHMMMEQFDNMVSNPLPHHYVGGNGEDVGKALAEGNRLYTQFSKADALEQAFGKAERRAASTYSGGNLENAQRQEVRKLFEKRQRGWTADELAQINRVIYGDAVQNTARGVGKALDPTGLKALIHGGLAVKTGGLSLLSAAAGYGAKHLSEKLSSNAIEELSRIIRAGGKRVSRVAPETAAERATRKLTPRLAGPAGYAASGLLSDENQ
jgi:hypothetical protein